MKKTLVALAVLAASGASFAQVTLSGELAYGFLSTTNGAGVTASGAGLDTALLTFAATEDLGGGYSASANMNLDSAANSRSGNTVNDNQVLTLKTPFATFVGGSWRPGNWLAGATGYGVWYGLDGKVLGARSARDSLGVSVPVTSAITLSATYYEPANAVGEGTGLAGVGIGTQLNMTYGIAYSAGALKASAGYVDYTNEGITDATLKNTMRIGANYDFGVAKVGAGMSVNTHSDSGRVTESLISVSAPIGALTLTAGLASNKLDADATSTVAALRGTRTGYMVGAQYNLSKRTYAIANFGSWEAAIADTQRSSLGALTLVHDF